MWVFTIVRTEYTEEHIDLSNADYTLQSTLQPLFLLTKLRANTKNHRVKVVRLIVYSYTPYIGINWERAIHTGTAFRYPNFDEQGNCCYNMQTICDITYRCVLHGRRKLYNPYWKNIPNYRQKSDQSVWNFVPSASLSYFPRRQERIMRLWRSARVYWMNSNRSARTTRRKNPSRHDIDMYIRLYPHSFEIASGFQVVIMIMIAFVHNDGRCCVYKALCTYLALAIGVIEPIAWRRTALLKWKYM